MTVVGNKTVGVDDGKSSAEDCNEEETRDFSKKNTLERAFKMSGGRTAHAAARHGHKLNGKLKRLHDQENEAFFASRKKESFETQATIERHGIEPGRESAEEKSNVTTNKKPKRSRSSNDIVRACEKSFVSMEKLHPMERSELCTPNSSSIATHGSASGIEGPSVTAGAFSSSDKNIDQCCKKREKTANKNDRRMKKYVNESSQMVTEKKLDGAGIAQLDRSNTKTYKKKKQKKKKAKAKSLCDDSHF